MERRKLVAKRSVRFAEKVMHHDGIGRSVNISEDGNYVRALQ